MANYRLSLEIEIDANSPLDAAKKLQEWIKFGMDFQYYVQDEYNEIFSVDLEEDDEDAVLPLTDPYFPIIKQ